MAAPRRGALVAAAAMAVITCASGSLVPRPPALNGARPGLPPRPPPPGAPVPSPAAAAGDGGGELAPGIDDAISPDSPFPNSLSIPELDIFAEALGGGAPVSHADGTVPPARLLRAQDRRRRLQPVPVDPDCDASTSPYAMVQPFEYFTGNFTGVRGGSFVSLGYSALVRNTTVLLDDYIDVVAAPGVVVECSASAAARVNAEGAVIRSMFEMDVRLSPAAADAHAAGVAHLVARLDAARGESVVVIGTHVALATRAFRRGGSCEHIGITTPYFSVVAFRFARAPIPGGAPAQLTLVLAPADVDRVFAGVDSTFEWDPDPHREVGRRRELGLYLPHDIDAQLEAHGRRTGSAGHGRDTAITWEQSFVDFSVNYDKATNSARTKILNILPGGLLYCQDCYAYLNVKLVVTFQMCLKVTTLSGRVYHYDTTDTRGRAYTYTGWNGQRYAEGGAPLPDCRDLGSPPDPNAFDIAFKVDAKLVGTAGFNVLLKSDGLDAAVTSCPTPRDTGISKAECVTTLLNDVALPRVNFLVGGVPVYVLPKIGLQSAGYATAKMPGRLQIGARAALSAQVGGYFHFAGTAMYNPVSSSMGVYRDLSGSWETHPFILEGFNSFSGSVVAHVRPVITLSIFEAVPIITRPVIETSYSLALSSGRRGEAIDMLPVVASAGGPREAQPCTGGSYSATYGASLAVGLQRTLLPEVPFVNRFMSSLGLSWLTPSYPVVDNWESGRTIIQPSTSVAGGCVAAAGSTPTPTATPTRSSTRSATPTPSTIPASATPSRGSSPSPTRTSSPTPSRTPSPSMPAVAAGTQRVFELFTDSAPVSDATAAYIQSLAPDAPSVVSYSWFSEYISLFSGNVSQFAGVRVTITVRLEPWLDTTGPGDPTPLRMAVRLFTYDFANGYIFSVDELITPDADTGTWSTSYYRDGAAAEAWVSRSPDEEVAVYVNVYSPAETVSGSATVDITYVAGAPSPSPSASPSVSPTPSPPPSVSRTPSPSASPRAGETWQYDWLYVDTMSVVAGTDTASYSSYISDVFGDAVVNGSVGWNYGGPLELAAPDDSLQAVHARCIFDFWLPYNDELNTSIPFHITINVYLPDGRTQMYVGIDVDVDPSAPQPVTRDFTFTEPSDLAAWRQGEDGSLATTYIMAVSPLIEPATVIVQVELTFYGDAAVLPVAIFPSPSPTPSPTPTRTPSQTPSGTPSPSPTPSQSPTPTGPSRNSGPSSQPGPVAKVAGSLTFSGLTLGDGRRGRVHHGGPPGHRRGCRRPGVGGDYHQRVCRGTAPAACRGGGAACPSAAVRRRGGCVRGVVAVHVRVHHNPGGREQPVWRDRRLPGPPRLRRRCGGRPAGEHRGRRRRPRRGRRRTGAGCRRRSGAPRAGHRRRRGRWFRCRRCRGCCRLHGDVKELQGSGSRGRCGEKCRRIGERHDRRGGRHRRQGHHPDGRCVH
jgi:hypothetical protein